MVRHCNWVRFLGKASHPSDANLLAQHNGDRGSGFIVIRQVAPNEELRAFFQDDDQRTSRGHLKVIGQGHRLGISSVEKEKDVINKPTTCGAFWNFGDQCGTPKTRWGSIVNSTSGSGSSGFSSSNWSDLEKTTKKANERIKNRVRYEISTFLQFNKKLIVQKI